MSEYRWRHGDAERAYDFCALVGLTPVPWQLEFLRRLEQRSMDEQFAEIVAGRRGGVW